MLHFEDIWFELYSYHQLFLLYMILVLGNKHLDYQLSNDLNYSYKH